MANQDNYADEPSDFEIELPKRPRVGERDKAFKPGHNCPKPRSALMDSQLRDRPVPAAGKIFGFLSLSPEVKNMIYEHLVVQTVHDWRADRRAGEIHIFNRRSFPPVLHCETNIFTVCRGVYEEASSIFYSQNTVVMDLIDWHQGHNHTFREDQGTGDRRTLRSGRSIDTTSFSGLIYPHVSRRFDNIQLTFHDLYDDLGSDPGSAEIVASVATLRLSLENLSQYLIEDPPTMGRVTGSKKCLFLEVIRSCHPWAPTFYLPVSDWHQRVMVIFANLMVVRVLRRLNMTRNVMICGDELTEDVIRHIHHNLFG